jgi:uncharacterized short protein YbdD (DUF466 family)
MENTSTNALELATGAPLRMKLRVFGRGVRAAYHQVFGIPDYEAYLDHVKREHPDCAPMSRREFFAASLDRKYTRKGPRCC